MPHARFQHFSTSSRPDLSAQRIAALREELARRRLDGLLLPRADIFQGEYLPPSEDRLAWLTGFTGSAGFAIVLKRRAALFADGRYAVQARAEVDRRVVKPIAAAAKPPEEWLRDHARRKTRIGYDFRADHRARAEALRDRRRGSGFRARRARERPLRAPVAGSSAAAREPRDRSSALLCGRGDRGQAGPP